LGIAFQEMQFLLEGRRQGDFGETLTLGHQELFLKRHDVGLWAREFHLDPPALAGCISPYVDELLKTFCGARDVVAVDFAAYEGATITHDMNLPVPENLEQRFDTVIDGGTLEHVFNFPIALANCMKLLRPGGRLFLFTPGNSQMGHGFYQFSPELLYRALGPAHGFEVESIRAVQFRNISTELGAVGAPLEVIDPALLATRTVVASRRPVGLQVRARKTRHMDRPFETAPQQSDYVQAWAGPQKQGNSGPFSLANVWEAISWRIPGSLKWPIWNEYGRLYRNTLRNRKWFRPVRKSDRG
jgi:SAM-dependent methyltransferase